MNYKDNLGDVKPFADNSSPVEDRIKAAKSLTEASFKRLALVRKAIKELDNSIKQTEDEELKRTFETFKKFFNVNGRLILLNLDFYVAFISLLESTDDWSYRVHARRIYTLMQETYSGFMKEANTLSHSIELIVAETYFQPYKDVIKSLNQFFCKYDKDFKEIRNANESHKDRTCEEQASSIENMRVSISSILIQGYLSLIAKLYVSMDVLFMGLNKEIQRLLQSE